MPGRSGCAGSACGHRDPHRHALHDLGEVAAGVVGRQQGEARAGRGAQRLDRAVEPGAVVGIDGELDRIADLHRLQLRLLQVGRHPHVARRHDGQQGLARLHQLARLDPAARDDTGDRGRDDGVADLGLGGADGGGGRGEPRIGALQRGGAGRHLALRGNRLAPRDVEVGDSGIVRRLRRIQLLRGDDLGRRESAIALEIGCGLASGRFRRGYRCPRLLPPGPASRRAAPRPARRCDRCRPGPAPRRGQRVPAAAAARGHAGRARPACRRPSLPGCPPPCTRLTNACTLGAIGVMWPSTCALSLVTTSRLASQVRRPHAAASRHDEQNDRRAALASPVAAGTLAAGVRAAGGAGGMSVSTSVMVRLAVQVR